MYYEDMLMPEHTHYTEDNTMHTENGRGAKEWQMLVHMTSTV